MVSLICVCAYRAPSTQAFRKCLLTKLMPSTECLGPLSSCLSSLPLLLWNPSPLRGPGNALSFSIASLICHHLSQNEFPEAWSTSSRGLALGPIQLQAEGVYVQETTRTTEEGREEEGGSCTDTLLHSPVSERSPLGVHW